MLFKFKKVYQNLTSRGTKITSKWKFCILLFFFKPSRVLVYRNKYTVKMYKTRKRFFVTTLNVFVLCSGSTGRQSQWLLLSNSWGTTNIEPVEPYLEWSVISTWDWFTQINSKYCNTQEVHFHYGRKLKIWSSFI